LTVIRLEPATNRARLTLEGCAIVPRLVEVVGKFARVALVAGGALLLGGDHVDIEIVVGDGCCLILEDIGGTVAYSADGITSRWDQKITVKRGATLVWKAHPLVIADEAHVVRSSLISLGEDASAYIRETLILGRAGEAGGVLASTTRIHNRGGPVFAEELNVAGHSPTPGLLGYHKVLDSVFWLGTERLPFDADTRVLELDEGGYIARQLSLDLHESSIHAPWDTWTTSAGRVQFAAHLTS
jgi:urease accessory protein